MAKRGAPERIADLLRAIDDALSFVRDFDEKRFLTIAKTDRRTLHAIKSAIGEIGEATKRLPDETKARHPKIDWRGVAGMRDILVHEYFRIDLKILWRTLREDLPALRAAANRESARARPRAKRR